MSTHPNVMLMAVLTCDDLARKTYRGIVKNLGFSETHDDPHVDLGGGTFHIVLMETSYNEDYQIGAPEGSIVMFHLATYGYGESIEWSELEKKKASLEEWVDVVCLAHHCSASYFVSANYW